VPAAGSFSAVITLIFELDHQNLSAIVGFANFVFIACECCDSAHVWNGRKMLFAV
jgi:hypothetical protein